LPSFEVDPVSTDDTFIRADRHRDVVAFDKSQHNVIVGYEISRGISQTWAFLRRRGST
jgi:hypothetical protein